MPMTTRSIAGLLLASALFGTAAHAAAATPKETLDAFYAALASGDRARALALLAPGVAIYEAGYVERSRDEYAGNHLGGDIEFAQGATRKVLKQTERIDGRTAVVWEETETAAVVQGQAARILGTGTAVLERNGDQWSIVHVHWSSRKPN
jgi:hypothetical protein